MEMKKQVLAAIFTIAISMVCASAQVREQNSFNAGVVLAEKELVGYEFHYYYKGDDGKGYYSDYGIFDLSGWLTELYIEDKEVLEGEKVPSIPLPSSGSFNKFSIYVYGLTEDGERVGFGEAHLPVVTKNTPIEIRLKIERMERVISIGGQQQDYRLSIDGGQIMAYYDTRLGGFRIWADIGYQFGNHTYEMIDQNGNIVTRGLLDGLYNTIEETADLGGLARILPPKGTINNYEDVSFFREEWLDGSVPTGDGSESYQSGKVLRTSFKKFPGSIYVSGNGVEHVDFYYVRNGLPIHIKRHEMNISENGGKYLNIYCPQYELPAVIVITGDKKVPFSLGVSHYDPDNGGGKGRPGK